MEYLVVRFGVAVGATAGAAIGQYLGSFFQSKKKDDTPRVVGKNAEGGAAKAGLDYLVWVRTDLKYLKWAKTSGVVIPGTNGSRSTRKNSGYF